MIETQKIIHHFSPVTDEARERVVELKQMFKDKGYKVKQQTYDNGISVIASITFKRN